MTIAPPKLPRTIAALEAAGIKASTVLAESVTLDGFTRIDKGKLAGDPAFKKFCEWPDAKTGKRIFEIYRDEYALIGRQRSTFEDGAKDTLLAEMVAEGMIYHEQDVYTFPLGNRNFMVELRLIEVTGEDL